MAPEIHQKKAYTGNSVDIFAAGTILFMCVAAHPPWSKAIAKDPFYKFIGGKRPDLFWKTMNKGKPEDYFSEEFKDLVTQMIDIADRRFDMEKVMAHPWYTSNDVPSYEEIK